MWCNVYPVTYRKCGTISSMVIYLAYVILIYRELCDTVMTQERICSRDAVNWCDWTLQPLSRNVLEHECSHVTDLEVWLSLTSLWIFTGLCLLKWEYNGECDVCVKGWSSWPSEGVVLASTWITWGPGGASGGLMRRLIREPCCF
jgi:hypothetical protein